MSAPPFTINNVSIGSEQDPPFIVAEISGNHNGSLDRMLELIHIASINGADAIKIQSYEASSLTLDCSEPDFQVTDGLWAGETLFSLYEKACTPFHWHESIFSFAKENNITVFSSPFDIPSVDMLESLDCPLYKIASFEINDHNLLRRVGATNKPVVISTGMSTLSEINEALFVLKSSGASNIILLKCTSAYPADPSDMNLLTIQNMRETFGCLVGLSDHTLDHTSSILSVAMGSCLIEKHFIDDRSNGGVDSAFSINSSELRELKRFTNDAFNALGFVNYKPTTSEVKNVQFRRSIYFCRDLPPDHLLTESDIRIVRPGFGLHPKYYPLLLGRKLRKSVLLGTRVSWDCFV